MKILNILLLGAILTLGHGVAVAENFDHEQLTTVEGNVYRDILILGADGHGLTFRHRGGVAKVPFPSLSESYRMFYEPVAELDETSAPVAPEEADLENGGEGDEFLFEEPVLLTARSRVMVILPQAWNRYGGVPCWERPAWPSWWPDHASVHRLAHPACRALAVRGFLRTTGLDGGAY